MRKLQVEQDLWEWNLFRNSKNWKW